MTCIYSGFHLMWTLVTVGSCLMWTFHQERIKLLRNMGEYLVIVGNPMPSSVKTIRFTHVVHVYKFILAFTTCLWQCDMHPDALKYAATVVQSAWLLHGLFFSLLPHLRDKSVCFDMLQLSCACTADVMCIMHVQQLSCACTVHILLYSHE